MSVSIRSGEATGLSIMKFTLIYDGELKSNGNPTKKQAIREKIHPQLQELWKTHPCLKALLARRYADLGGGGYAYFEEHHSIPPRMMAKPQPDYEPLGDPNPQYLDLCEPVKKAGMSFMPLVRERTALRCALGITFLRYEEPGRIVQGGDIDNRLKTLFDALTVPQHDEQVSVGKINNVFCLLEDDSLITGLEVQTRQMLGRPNSTKNDVHLIIDVDVRVANPKGYNQMFLGD